MLQRDAPNLSLTIPFLFVARARKENRDWPHKSLHAWKTRLLDLGEGNLLKLPCTTARSKTFGVLESRVVSASSIWSTQVSALRGDAKDDAPHTWQRKHVW